MKIAIGTSGFQYPEWRGKFYPETLSTAKMLGFYAEHFRTTESNYSFRRIPSEKTIANWSAGTPADFCFSLKAPQKITHFAKLRDCMETVDFFWKIVRGLEAKLGAILFQLPPSLKKDVPLLAAFLDGLPAEMRAAFEFRHESWFDDEVFTTLQTRGAALCVAESSDLKTPRVATAPFGYLRLRREDYRPAELSELARWVREQKWKDACLYFKHEELAIGPKFALAMQKLLG
ncbi:MAG TPA: DUF72 domain-containing protein [Chthoniobacterales bacterium]|nr:DUF72 domain-containing protein [Chthoniobacterales bacterium]